MKFVLRQIIWIALILNCTILVAQDDCGTATTITPGASCSYTTFNLPGSLTKSSTAVTGCNSAFIVDDGWIKFTATTTRSIIQYSNTTRDAALYAYSGTCPGSLTQIGCADNVFGLGVESLTLTTVSGKIGRAHV